MVVMPASNEALRARKAAASSAPPHIHPPMAQAPKAMGVTDTVEVPRVLRFIDMAFFHKVNRYGDKTQRRSANFFATSGGSYHKKSLVALSRYLSHRNLAFMNFSYLKSVFIALL